MRYCSIDPSALTDLEQPPCNTVQYLLLGPCKSSSKEEFQGIIEVLLWVLQSGSIVQKAGATTFHSN
ncbi:hypothetical protein J5N97_005247 [Dioscorea zingiberensis]|uniref:Uncharacterized protein n=1 Tax=Dioscorea zingiberensis TaxID=325984 RepID=A0A9D5D876_9LILI|nr:hypothetical protein J5N97_005247 [Dioscorea zingiberensis]